MTRGHVSRASTSALLSIALVVLAVLASGCSSDADSADAPAPSASSSAGTPPPAAPTTPATPTGEEFCGAFVRFASAQSQYQGEQNAATVEELVTAALVLGLMPPAEGMTPGARASLITLVNGTIDTLVPESDLPTADADPDDAAFAAYLQDVCPA